MSLERLGLELRQQRQLKNISLMDIASDTRINLAFLEAMEEGRFEILPQTYVRAFIREYASLVGLDPVEMMQKYDEARGAKVTREPSHPSGKAVVQPTEETNGAPSGLSDLQRKVVLGVLILASVTVAVYLLTSTTNTISTPPQEIPFDRVVRETEAATIKPDTNPAATAAVSPVASPVTEDSLRLEMATTDSVWISITIDNKKSEQYLLGPRKHKQWAAKEQFAISMGNAGGATFALNGKDLGQIGKRGGVVRNTILNAASLKTP